MGWGWYDLSTVLDDFSRYVVSWELCTTMRAEDVMDTLVLALEASGYDQPTVLHRPRLLSGCHRSAIGSSNDGDGSSYIAGKLATWLDGKGMDHLRGAPSHPQTQGKIERWHQTLKNRILLENHYLPGALEPAIGDCVDHDNHRRVHESLGNVTPADAYFGRAPAILENRRRIKDKTIRQRRSLNQKTAA